MAKGLLKGLGSAAKFAATGLVGGKIIKAITGGSKSKTPAAVSTERAMPTPDDEAIRNARKRALISRSQASGRTSTILTGDDGGKLGG